MVLELMFSGIIEEKSIVTDVAERPGFLNISLARPSGFDDLTAGDSIAVDGVCLTLEKFDLKTLIFALGPETLKITGWLPQSVKGRVVNLERSLKLGDRIHGHLVTGHVDAIGFIKALTPIGETLTMKIGYPPKLGPYIWPKGSIAINGVSLTINSVTQEFFEVGLIPETLKRTNLGEMKIGDQVNLEADNLARGLVHQHNIKQEV